MMRSYQPMQTSVFAVKPVRPLRYIKIFNRAAALTDRISGRNDRVAALNLEIKNLEWRHTKSSVEMLAFVNELKAQTLVVIEKDKTELSTLQKILEDGAGAFADFADKVRTIPISAFLISAVGIVASAAPWFKLDSSDTFAEKFSLQNVIIFAVSAITAVVSTRLLVLMPKIEKTLKPPAAKIEETPSPSEAKPN